jgi:hypothetical protein
MKCETCLRELNFNPRNHATHRGRYYAPLCKYCVNSVNGKADVSNLEGRVTFLEENDKTYLNSKAVMEELAQLKASNLYLKKIVSTVSPGWGGDRGVVKGGHSRNTIAD